MIPTVEVDRWSDLDPATTTRVFFTAQHIGQALIRVYNADRAGLVIAGFHVPPAHVHVFPTHDLGEFDFTDLPAAADPAVLAEQAARISDELHPDGP